MPHLTAYACSTRLTGSDRPSKPVRVPGSRTWQNSPAWLKYRLQSTGASSAGVLLGFSDKSAGRVLGLSGVPIDDDALPALLERIYLRTPSKPPNLTQAFNFEFGHQHEVNALAVLLHATPGLRLLEAGMYRVPLPAGMPPMHASPDAIGELANGERIVVEAKSKVPYRYDSNTGLWTLLLQRTPTSVDPAHMAQVQLQLLATGLRVAKLIVVPATDAAVVFTITRSDEWLAGAQVILEQTLGLTREGHWRNRPRAGFLDAALPPGVRSRFIELTNRLCQEAANTGETHNLPTFSSKDYEPAFLPAPADLHAYEKAVKSRGRVQFGNLCTRARAFIHRCQLIYCEMLSSRVEHLYIGREQEQRNGVNRPDSVGAKASSNPPSSTPGTGKSGQQTASEESQLHQNMDIREDGDGDSEMERAGDGTRLLGP